MDGSKTRVQKERPEKIKRKKTAEGHYPETHYETVKQIFLYAAEHYADRSFILDKDNPKDKDYRSYSFREFGDDVRALGTVLTGVYGLKDERVVIIGENQYAWYVSYMAVLIGAGIAVPVDKELPENEIENVINRARASAVIYSSRLEDKIKSVADVLPTVKHYIKMRGEPDKTDARFVSFDSILEKGRGMIENGDRSFFDIVIDPDEFRALFFTSGTTANSKGVMVNNRQLANNVNAVSAYVDINEYDRFFSVLPLHHTYESSIGFLLPLAYGCSIAVCQGLKYIASNLKESEPTVLIAVPLVLEHLYKNVMKNIKKSHKEKLVALLMQITNVPKKYGVNLKKIVFRQIYAGIGGRLRFVVSAAAPIDKTIGKWYSDLGINFLQGYGLTETSPISAVTPDYDKRIGSAGKTILNGKIMVCNPDEKGEGELLISTDTLMMGYYEDEASTSEVIEYDSEGRRWFHSGDIGYADKDDYIYITGRIKNVIVTQNGKNIFPEELELLLSGVEEIEECMVYGKKIEGSNELTVTCRAIPDYDKIREFYGEKDIDEIKEILWKRIEEVNKKVSAYKAIRSLEIKDGEFIKTTTQKIKRFSEVNEGRILAVR